MPGATSEYTKEIPAPSFALFMSMISQTGCLFRSACLVLCSAPEWDEIDPSEREDLHLQMEDGEFW